DSRRGALIDYMDYSEVTNKNTGELQILLAASREQLRGLRFRIANREVKDVREIRVVRQTIARLLTEINRRRHPAQP
ncbi:MAG: 50S ribosomal protein L29, partial [Patescibacteria group bacterium]